MRKIIFIVVASALVSIVPFLALFDPECFPTHGIIIFSIFIIFFLYTNIRPKITSQKKALLLIFSVYAITSTISWIDLQSILKLLGKPTSFYGIIPFVMPAIALFILKDIKAVPFKQINLIVFSIIFLHLIFFYTYPINYPILSFPILNQVHFQDSSKNNNRTILKTSLLKEWKIIDSTNIVNSFIDTTRSNVIILVESWGIPIDKDEFSKTMDIFNDTEFFRGIHKRNFSSTQKAQMDDMELIKKHLEDTHTIIQLGKTGYFDSVSFKSVESILDSCSNNCTIALTTNDTSFPIKGKPEEIFNSYKLKLVGTLSQIKDLIIKYPNVNFIIHGDHEPILSPIEFQEKFYKRWVPFVATKPQLHSEKF